MRAKKSLRRIYQEKEFLEDQMKAGKTIQEIATICGITVITARKWMRHHKLISEPVKKITPYYRSKEWLENKLKNNVSEIEMAAECGVAVTTIRNWLKKYGLYSPNPSTIPLYKDRAWLKKKLDNGVPVEEIAKECGCTVNTIVYWMDVHHLREKPDKLYKDREWMREQILAGKTRSQIALSAKCSPYTVNVWIMRHKLNREIEMR